MRLRLPAVLLLCAAISAAPSSKNIPTKYSPAQVERGRYLVESVAPCLICHSEMDFKGARPRVVRKFSGGPFTGEELPFPVYVPNISPDPETGSGRWSDEQLARAIREGIGYDGRVLFPLMPYMSFRAISDDDVGAIIAYLRSVPPVNKPTRTPTVPDEVRKQVPPPPPLSKPVRAPNLKDPVQRGRYLMAIADCTGCHTPSDDKGNPLPGLKYGGGFTMKGPWGTVTTANITPDPSGISYYDEKLFIQTIRTGHVKARKLSGIMPTFIFRNMTDQDLKAIFANLRTLKPVKHRVDNTEPPTYCKVCRGTHGGGALN